jgi:hypothetical protein
MALKTVRINQNGAGTQTIEAAPGAKFRHVVVSISMNVSAVTALPQVESGANVIAGPYGAAVGLAVNIAGSRVDPLFWCNANEALEVVAAGAGLVTGHITYFTEQVAP